MDRLFGKELSNLGQINAHNKVKLIGRIHSQSTRSSTTEDPTRVLLKRFNRSNVNQSQQQKVQKPQPLTHRQTQEKVQIKDTQMVEEYFQDCLKYMLSQEQKNYKLKNYIPQQTQINQKMRGILLDWLIELHLKFKMFTHTIYITIMIIDMYLSKKEASKENLQLIGAAAFYIAAKYEQTYQVPQIDQLVHYSAKAFTKPQVIQMQAEIIETLQFKLTIETSFKFFEPLTRICKMQLKNVHLAQYVLQLSLLQTKFLEYKPSQLAASSIYLINKIRKRPQSWPTNMQSLTGYTEKELKNCARQLCHLLQRADQLPNAKSLKKKFSLVQYNQVTRIKLERKKH